MKTRYLALSAAMMTLAFTTGGAQLDRVPQGARIRLWLPEPQQQQNAPWRRQLLRGTAESVSGDLLQLRVPGAEGTLSIRRADIHRLDVSRGTSRVASAFERALGFAVVGAITAAIENDPTARRWPNLDTRGRAAAEGAKWGAAFGAVVGFVLPTERWRKVSLR